jgi:orotidine-5'-phosphate decarboxylase
MVRRMFSDQLLEAVRAKKSPCVVGLDPSPSLVPDEAYRAHELTRSTATIEQHARVVADFCVAIIDAVHDIVPAVKPQSAYFEALGSAGIAAMERTIVSAKRKGLIVILDAKRGDVPSTAEAYAAAYLSRTPARDYECDALTVNPYLGRDSMKPFFDCAKSDGKGVFVCAKTSNPGSGDFQDRMIDGTPLYELVAESIHADAEQCVGRGGYSNIGFVVGGTFPEMAQRLRSKFSRTFFLVPGFGAQGASAATVGNYFNSDGFGALVSSSRRIMYPHRFGSSSSWSKEAVRAAAIEFSKSVAAVI